MIPALLIAYALLMGVGTYLLGWQWTLWALAGHLIGLGIIRVLSWTFPARG